MSFLSSCSFEKNSIFLSHLFTNDNYPPRSVPNIFYKDDRIIFSPSFLYSKSMVDSVKEKISNKKTHEKSIQLMPNLFPCVRGESCFGMHQPCRISTSSHIMRPSFNCPCQMAATAAISDENDCLDIDLSGLICHQN